MLTYLNCNYNIQNNQKQQLKPKSGNISSNTTISKMPLYKKSPDNSLFRLSDYGIISIKNTKKDANIRPKYFEYEKIRYSPNTEQELRFVSGLNDLSSLKESVSENSKNDNFVKFSNSYFDLLSNIVTNNTNINNIKDGKSDYYDENAKNKLLFTFSSLVESLDKANNNYASTKLNEILFDNFLSSFGNINFIQNAVSTYANSDILEHQPLKKKLGISNFTVKNRHAELVSAS